MKARAVRYNLAGLWNKLGVEPFGEVFFNDRAPTRVSEACSYRRTYGNGTMLYQVWEPRQPGATPRSSTMDDSAFAELLHGFE